MKELLNHILTESEDIFKPVTKEEISIRRRQYLKSLFDDLESEGRLIHNEDGTVDVIGNLNLYSMNLGSLLNLPYEIRKVTGWFNCAGNDLTTLEGAPRQVGDDFYCFSNQLTSLKGAPDYVGGDVNCVNNNLPKDVRIPSKIKGRIIR